ncbi:MAG: FAD-binding oxidoreductase, partial [Promethearchaeota archaeon]
MSDIKLEPEIIKKDLEERVKGEVAIDDITRNFYSTDASVYRIVPSCVVRPKDKEDVKAVIKYAYDKGIPIHPRGGGSGLGGACLGPGIVLTIRDH